MKTHISSLQKDFYRHWKGYTKAPYPDDFEWEQINEIIDQGMRRSERHRKLKKAGKRICGYAATSKSTTILNYCNLNTDIIDFICDTTNEKIGKFSPGVHIPIVPISYFHKNLPDVAYLFAWNHKDEIFSKEKEFLKKGGSWFSHVSLQK